MKRNAVVLVAVLASVASARGEETFPAAPAELLAPAEDVRQAALASFREGTADVLKLIDAERVHAEVRLTAAGPRVVAWRPLPAT